MHSIVRRGTALGVVAALLISGSATIGVVKQAAARSTGAASNANWPAFGNTSDNTRYAALSQINTGNVGKLGLAWTAQEGGNLANWETDPVVVNGVMYLTTNTDQVRAVNAATGKLLWQFTPQVNFTLAVAGGGGGTPTNRGVAVANGKVYLLTFDDQLIALQASTGEKLWSSKVANSSDGYSETSPATYWNGMLFVGSAESDAGLRGFVAAYNANTGKQIWRFFTVPATGQSWVPKTGHHGGGDVWMPQTIDTTSGILYFGTGNPSPDLNNSQRPGPNPWVDATVAVNARTGKFLWGHTEVNPDVWDYDSDQMPMLFNVRNANGTTVRAVAHANKGGLFFVYDAKTGKVLAQSPHLGQYTIPHLAPTAKGVTVCPGDLGGLEFSPPAYSPITQLAYEPGLNNCDIFKLAPQVQNNVHTIGAIDLGGTVMPTGKNSGFMAAADTRTGKIAWKTTVPAPMIGGALATAGGLIFSGSDNGTFYGFNSANGKVLWKTNVGLAFGAAPLTYQVNGTQYIAVATGGAAVSTVLGDKVGGTLAVFKLNGQPVNTARFPAAKNPSSLGGAGVITTKGLTKVNQFMFDDPKTQIVTIVVAASQTTDNSGFNFDGYDKGRATYIVPAGWRVNWIFSNKSALPHSAALIQSLKTPMSLTSSLGSPIATPNAVQGIVAGKMQFVSFAAVQPGNFFLACLVPGHIQAGMWDNFIVSATAKAPSLQIK